MTRRLWAVAGNGQWLDGGAMFGNAPRALWQRWIAPDEQGRIPLACRSLLVDDGRKILFEAGVGAFFPPRLRERYGVVAERHVLCDSLRQLGLEHGDVDVVVLSHLHFDHAGGLFDVYREGQAPRLLFPNAHFLVSRRAWERALSPHERDRASFIPELPALLEATGRLELCDGGAPLGEGYRFHFSDGHTPGMMLAEIATVAGPLLFAADLIPGEPWLHLPITMGYDRYPELLIDEKRELLARLHREGGWIFFTHDPRAALCRLGQGERGRYMAADLLEHTNEASVEIVLVEKPGR